MKFFERMLTVFFDRHIADSTSAKPRFMKNTSAAVISTQTVSMATVSSSAVLAWAFEARARHPTSMPAVHNTCRLRRFMVSPRAETPALRSSKDRRSRYQDMSSSGLVRMVQA